ncbi:hypothetical protein TNCV_3146191 [Trichonephila clavipes]|nr:hypothetical protein TNCV_3146191 [Trichonephila clavipes]
MISTKTGIRLKRRRETTPVSSFVMKLPLSLLVSMLQLREAEIMIYVQTVRATSESRYCPSGFLRSKQSLFPDSSFILRQYYPERST